MSRVSSPAALILAALLAARGALADPEPLDPPHPPPVAQSSGPGDAPADPRALGVADLRLRLFGEVAPEARVMAADALFERSGPEAAAVLRDAFKSDREPVLLAVLAAAAGNRDARFAPEIAALLVSTREPVQQAALAAVGEISDKAMVQALSQVLKAQTNGVALRKRVILALGLTRSAHAVPVLLPLLEGHPEEITAETQKALHALTFARFPSRSDWNAWWDRNGDRGRERWLEDALQAAAGSVPTVDTDVQALQAKVRELNGTIVQIRLEAARASGKPDAEVQLLLGFLENREFAEVRDRVLDELSKVGRQKSAAALPAVMRLLEDPDRRIVLAAIRCLGEIGDAPAADAVGRFLAPVQEQEARRAAARSLARIATPNVLPLLVGALDEPDPAVLLGVIEGVKVVRARTALPKLKTILAARRDQPAVVKGILDALGEIGDPEAVPILVEFLAGSHPEADHAARWSAANSLGKLGRPEASGALVALLEDQFTDVRQTAVEALGRIGDAGASEALGRTVRQDKDPVVRELAAQSLGKLGNAATLDVLLPVLDDTEPRVAKAAWTAMLALAGKSVPLLESLVDKLYAAKHPKEAVDVLRRLAPAASSEPGRLTPAQAAVQLRLGKALFEAKEWKDAQPILETSAKWWPENREVKTQLGILYRELGNADAAFKIFGELLDGSEAGSADWWSIKVERLAVRLLKKEFDTVLAEVQRLLAGTPPPPEALRPRLEELRAIALKAASASQERKEELNRTVRDVVARSRGAAAEALRALAQELARIGRDAVPVLLSILADGDPADWPAASHHLGVLTNIQSPLTPETPLEQREQAIQQWAQWLQAGK